MDRGFDRCASRRQGVFQVGGRAGGECFSTIKPLPDPGAQEVRRGERGRRVSSEKFSADEWIDRLAPALAKLADAHEPYLQGYYRKSSYVHAVHVGLERNAPAFPLDDVRMLYASARHGGGVGEEEYYAPLRAALDPARYILISHPVLAPAARLELFGLHRKLPRGYRGEGAPAVRWPPEWRAVHLRRRSGD